ncbi:hypothetical protein [Streptomyces sp. NPDC088923]|uniref:hypothetical protein n=1 Tax=Streptomyces sp. NPDC088923 TaxID=3365913 RepID=UPI003818E86A
MTTIAWGPLGRGPLWQAVVHLAALEAREPVRAAEPVRAEPVRAAEPVCAAEAVRTGPPGAVRAVPLGAAAPRAPEIGRAHAARPPRPRTVHHPARTARKQPPQEPGTVRPSV